MDFYKRIHIYSNYNEKILLRFAVMLTEEDNNFYNPNLNFAPMRHQRPGWGMVA